MREVVGAAAEYAATLSTRATVMHSQRWVSTPERRSASATVVTLSLRTRAAVVGWAAVQLRRLCLAVRRLVESVPVQVLVQALKAAVARHAHEGALCHCGRTRHRLRRTALRAGSAVRSSSVTSLFVAGSRLFMRALRSRGVAKKARNSAWLASRPPAP